MKLQLLSSACPGTVQLGQPTGINHNLIDGQTSDSQDVQLRCGGVSA